MVKLKAMNERAPRNKPRNNKSGRPTGPARSRAPVQGSWSVPIPVAEIPQAGRRVELTADAATRDAVAKAVSVLALPRLVAVFDLAPFAENGIRVSGAVSATVEQNCVVTLDPVTSEVEEPIELTFVAANAAPPAADLAALPNGDDPPEVLQKGIVDLGSIACEFLFLGIDPYPRKPGASFHSPESQRDPSDHPFSALASLKKPE